MYFLHNHKKTTCIYDKKSNIHCDAYSHWKFVDKYVLFVVISTIIKGIMQNLTKYLKQSFYCIEK